MESAPKGRGEDASRIDAAGDEAGDDLVTLSAFTEPVTMMSLVDMVATTLEINLAVKGDVPGQVVFNAPVPVKKSELLDLLDQMLEQQGWTVTKERFGFYVVHPLADIRPIASGERVTTRVFSTPNIRPSALKPVIEGQFGVNPQMGGASRQYTYMDELGLIVATDSPRKLAIVEELIGKISEEFRKSNFIRIELTHIAAPVAKERALQLIGQLQQPLTGNVPAQFQNQVMQQGVPGMGGGALSNMGERLTVDPQGNALIFRGQPDEVRDVQRVMAIIDRPNTLVPKQYFAGSSAKQIADLARGQGLGEVTTITSAEAAGVVYNYNIDGGAPGQGRQTGVGGPVMVVDEASGNIIYYATPEQQARLDTLIKELDTKSDRVTLETYKLRNSDAEDVAEILNNIITNTQPLGTSPLLPGGGVQPRAMSRSSAAPIPGQTPTGASATGGYEGFGIDASAFVIPDIANNQLIVKAKGGQQKEFARLIEKLDRRRPQVYVEATIVAVTTDDTLRTAFETQLINANGTGGVLNTGFGLGSFATGAQPLLLPKTVGAGGTGLVAAVIKSDQVPIIMRALANETNSRIISTPQLLVDDNEEATVASIDTRPVQTIRTGNTNNTGDVITSDREVEAGTTLMVKPQIGDAGYVRLKYEIELSSFTGEGTNNLPPPRQRNTLQSESVTVPHDSTVVVGGLALTADTKSVAKVPLIGDIPLIGLLFQDRAKGDRKTTLYVFLTPRILRDPSFEDLRLLTSGPQSVAGIEEEIPELLPRRIELDHASLSAPMATDQETESRPSNGRQSPPSTRETTPPETRRAVVRPIPPVRESDRNEQNPD